MISLLYIIQQFSAWSGIYINTAKCKITAYIHNYNPSLKNEIEIQLFYPG